MTVLVDSSAVITPFSSNATSANSQVLTVAVAVPAGEYVVISYGAVATTSASTFTATDSRGNTYTVLATTFRSTFEEVALIGSLLGTGLQVGDTITVSTVNTLARRCYQVKSYTGLTATVDTTGSAVSSGGATSAPSDSLAPAASGEFLLSACCYSSNLATTTPTWPTGWTADATSNDTAAGGAEKTLTISDHVATASGSQSSSLALSSSRSWAMVTVALVPSAGAGNARTASDAPTVTESAHKGSQALSRTASDAPVVSESPFGGRSSGTPPGYDGVVVSDPQQFGATGALTQALTVTRAVPAGETVIVVFGCQGGVSAMTYTATDSRGNTYTTLATTALTNIAEVALVGSVLTTGLQVGDTITFNSSISRARRCYQVKSFHGVTLTADVAATLVTGNDPSPEADITTVNAYDLVFAAAMNDNIQTTVWDSSYQGVDTTSTTAGSNEKMLTSAFKIPAAPAAEAATFITPTTSHFAMVAVALRTVTLLRVSGAADAVPVADSPSSNVHLSRTASDSVPVADVATRLAATTHSFVRTVSEAPPITDAATAAFNVTNARTAVDSALVTELPARAKLPAPSQVSTSVPVSDSVSFTYVSAFSVGTTQQQYRWKFVDPNDSALTYFFERNPLKVDSPNTTQVLDAMSTGPFWLPNVRGISPAHVPVQWSFTGTIASQAMYNALAGWAKVRRVVQVVDDLGQAFSVLPVSFEPTDRPPTARNPKRWSYVFKCLRFESTPVGSPVTITIPTPLQRRVIDLPSPYGVLTGAPPVYVPPTPAPAPLPPGSAAGNGIPGGSFTNPVQMVGSTKGQSTYQQMVAALLPDIVYVKEGVGVVPLAWVNTAAALVPEGNRVIYALHPDVAILAQGTGAAYAKLVLQLRNLLSTMPDIDGQRVMMWPNPYGKTFTAASWVNASINFWSDVVTPVNTLYGRANRVRYVIGMQGSQAGTGTLVPYLGTLAKYYADEVGYNCSSLAQAQAGITEAALSPARPMIVPELTYGEVYHTDAQILAWMQASVPRLAAAAVLCWDNRNNNQIVGTAPLSTAFWATLSTFAGAPAPQHFRRAAAEVALVSETPTNVVHQVLSASSTDLVPASDSVQSTSPHKAGRTTADAVPVADSAAGAYVPGILITKFGADDALAGSNWSAVSAAYDQGAHLAAVRMYQTVAPTSTLFNPVGMPTDGRTVLASWQPTFGQVAAGVYDLPVQRLMNLGQPIYLAAWDGIDALVAAGTVTAAQVALWQTDMAHLATLCAGSLVKPTIVLSGAGYQSYQTYKVPFVNAYAFNLRNVLDPIRHNLAYPGTAGGLDAVLAYMVNTVQQTDGHEILVSEFGWPLGAWPNATTQRTAALASYAAKFRQAGVGVACFFDFGDFVAADLTEIHSLVAGGP